MGWTDGQRADIAYAELTICTEQPSGIPGFNPVMAIGGRRGY